MELTKKDKVLVSIAIMLCVGLVALSCVLPFVLPVSGPANAATTSHNLQANHILDLSNVAYTGDFDLYSFLPIGTGYSSSSQGSLVFDFDASTGNTLDLLYKRWLSISTSLFSFVNGFVRAPFDLSNVKSYPSSLLRPPSFVSYFFPVAFLGYYATDRSINCYFTSFVMSFSDTEFYITFVPTLRIIYNVASQQLTRYYVYGGGVSNYGGSSLSTISFYSTSFSSSVLDLMFCDDYNSVETSVSDFVNLYSLSYSNNSVDSLSPAPFVIPYFNVADHTYFADTSASAVVANSGNIYYDRSVFLGQIQQFGIVTGLLLNDTGSGTDVYNNGYSSGFNNGYEQGNTEGYNTGYKDGQTEGMNEGVEAGKLEGYNSGYSAGVASASDYSFLSLMGSVVDAPLNAFTSLLNFEILGTNLSSFVLGLTIIALGIVILKKVL